MIFTLACKKTIKNMEIFQFKFSNKHWQARGGTGLRSASVLHAYTVYDTFIIISG